MKSTNTRWGLMLLIVVVIGILAAIAITSFVRLGKNSAMNSCIANMKQLEGAREQALLAGRNALTSTILLHNTDIVITNAVSHQINDR